MKLKGFYFCLFSLITFCVPALAENEAEKVIVVANSSDPASLDVATHYMRSRGIPEKNLIAFPMPKTETVTWNVFAETMHEPLARNLTERGLIDGTLSDKKDKYGRNILMLPANVKLEDAKAEKAISYLVLCRGVPLRIQNEESLLPPLPPAKEGQEAPKRLPLDVNNASVDSEFSLIAIPGTEIKGFIPNPFFKSSENTQLKSLFIKVARLDGPTPEDAKALVDNAIRAEKNGLLGRAYIDVGGPHKEGDNWLNATADIIRKLGFDMTVEKSRSLISALSRYDAPALYFGWYAGSVSGFFTDPNFRFPAGACAIHIHSFSATTMRNNATWTPGLVARGVTATVGNVYEPYLGLTHYPHYFMEALVNGMTAGDAAAYSLPGLSWQAIFVGDPLYRPFKKSLDEQLADSMEHPGRLTQYAYLRAINLLKKEESKKIAQLEREGMMFSPGLALALAIAERERVNFATNTKWKFNPSNLVSENPGLLLEVCRFLAKHGNADKAIKIYSEIIARNIVPEDIRLMVLKEASICAQTHSISSAPVSRWQEEIIKLTPKPKK